MKIDPEKMATDLNYWNKVSPEGAEFYSDNYFVEGWYKRVDGRLYFMSRDDFEPPEMPRSIERRWLEVVDSPNKPPMIAKPVFDTKDDEVSILRKRIEELEARVNSLSSDTENEEWNIELAVGEEHIGRLVMVSDYDDKEYRGPMKLTNVAYGENFQFYTNDGISWKFAKLYTGPTSPNWIEYDGHGVPDDLQEGDRVLVQFRNGTLYIPDNWLYLRWCWGGIRETPEDIMRYTKLDC